MSGKSAIGGFISGAIAGGASGAVGGFITGLALTGDLNKAWSMAGQGALYGGITGAALGGYRGYKAAQNAGKDPWTGMKTKWPSNNGFKGATTMQELQPGDVIDRYGGTSNESRFASPEGVPLDQRSLSPSTNTNIYERYEVVKPFTVESGTVAPWFGQPGLGIQYQTQLPIKMLEMQGYLRFIP